MREDLQLISNVLEGFPNGASFEQIYKSFVFLWAYERSAQRYAAIRQSMGEPDGFRLKYREEIRALIRQVIVEGMNVEAATALIGAYIGHITQTDRARFTEVVETELLSLHEGNFARYGVRPSEFSKWNQLWDRR